MNRIKTALFAIFASLAALSGAASEPADRVRPYTYDAAGNITQIGSDVYVYDGVSRVVSGTVSGRERLYTYDAFGNRRTCWDVGSQSTCQWGAEIASALNRVIGAGYDDGGNLASYSGQTYAYDSEGMMTSRNQSATEYVYTADDERIAVVTGAAWKWTLRDGSGKVLRELASTAAPDGTHANWHWTRDNVFRNGILLSTVDPSGTRHYHVDHLGTPRVVSDTQGGLLGVHDYFAFGLELNDNLTEQDPANLRFTGHERDADGLDYMHARFYEPKWGRFLSVDPTWESADLDTPQSWNRYAYVQNRPMILADPDGENPAAILISGAISVGAESIRQIRSNQPVDNKRLAAALVGGMISGAIPGGSSLKAAFASGAVGSTLSGFIQRKVAGEKTTVVNVVVDAVSGGLGRAGGRIIGGSMVSRSASSGKLNELQWKAAFERAAARDANAGLGADKVTNKEAKILTEALTRAGGAVGNVAGKVFKEAVGPLVKLPSDSKR